MADNKIPGKWKKSDKSIRAIQVAFEFSGNIPTIIRDEASRHGLSPSDQIRKIIGLSVKAPKRPRLTVSLSEEDYEQLADEFNLPIDDKDGIREAIRHRLISFSEDIEKDKP